MLLCYLYSFLCFVSVFVAHEYTQQQWMVDDVIMVVVVVDCGIGCLFCLFVGGPQHQLRSETNEVERSNASPRTMKVVTSKSED